MIYRLGVLLVVVTYISVTAALPPCVCTRELKPVCGSDGQTYNNMCLLKCQQQSKPSLQLEKHGRCRSERDVGNTCACTFEYSPVCGSNGRTFPNKCSLKCEGGNLRVVHEGECKQKREISTCVCTDNYDPVCGTNGKTYSNKCELNCEQGIEVASEGACKAERADVDQKPVENKCICTLDINPVCGSNGRTYDNLCLMKCEGDKVKLVHRGECREKRELPPCQCTREANAVCGTDGNTYSNPCLLNCAREQNENLHISHPGPCKKNVARRDVDEPKPQPICACTRNLEPVCASNGVTYSNPCLMRCAGANLTVEKNEPCEN